MDQATYCSYKGDCAYYSIPLGGERSVDAVWTYEAPYAAVAAIRDHVAFYPDRWTPSRNDRAASRFPRGPAKPKARQPTDQVLTWIFHAKPDWRRPLKLYHSSGSPNSRRVRILIAEKGLDIELAPVDLGQPDDVGDVVAFLGSNEARWINGDTVRTAFQNRYQTRYRHRRR
jgi:hypothetical protein